MSSKKNYVSMCVGGGQSAPLRACVCVWARAAFVNGQLSINNRARGFCYLSGLLLLNSFS